MKNIFLILGIIILISCNPKSREEVKITKAQVVKNIAILREAGFFEKHNGLTDLEVYYEIYESRKQEYLEIFEKSYDPGMELTPINLALSDINKVLFIDLEADVGKGNDVYISVIKAFSKLSNGKFNPNEIRENWEKETGPIKVSFKSNDSLIVFEPEYNDDWIHESVFSICERELEKRDIRITDCLSDDGYGYGQAIAIMRLTKNEQNVLEKKLNWQFSSN